MDIYQFWKDVLTQDAEAIKSYFHKDAYVNWHCSNEHFTLDEFMNANCEYPGDWDGNVERAEIIDHLIISVTHVYSKDKKQSFHVTSFIQLVDDKIISVDEYWAEDGTAPKWRKNRGIGTTIRE